jgi:hypothetical protein
MLSLDGNSVKRADNRPAARMPQAGHLLPPDAATAKRSPADQSYFTSSCSR